MRYVKYVSGLTVQAILQAAYPLFASTHAVAWHVRRAMGQLLRCGTGELGYYERRCPEGHFSQIEGRSCGHRACPRCGWRRGQQWLAGWRERLLPGTHFHVVFTVPSELHELWRANRRIMAEMLFNAARDTLMLVLGDAAYLGAQPGILMALHTWSRTLSLHPHVHCLVTAGGLAADGVWKHLQGDFLAPIGVLREIFRGKLLSAIEQGWKQGKLCAAPGREPGAVARVLQQAARKQWNVRIEPPYRHGEGLAIYLARYMCGGPIGRSRLVSFDVPGPGRGRVEFVVGREASKPATMALESEEFLRRLCEHIPECGVRVMRSYGLYASSKREQLRRVRREQGATQPEAAQAPGTAQENEEDKQPRCPECGKLLEVVEIERSGRRRTTRSPPRWSWPMHAAVAA